MNDCSKFENERVLFAFGELEDAAAAKHIRGCGACRSEIDAIRKTAADYAAASTEPSPVEPRAVATEHNRVVFRRVLTAASGAAACFALFLLFHSTAAEGVRSARNETGAAVTKLPRGVAQTKDIDSDLRDISLKLNEIAAGTYGWH